MLNTSWKSPIFSLESNINLATKLIICHLYLGQCWQSWHSEHETKITKLSPSQTWRDLANCPIENYANNKIINRLQFSALTRFWMGRAECKQTPHFGILIRRGGLLCNILTYKTLSSNCLLLIKWWASICQSQCRCRGIKVRAFTIWTLIQITNKLKITSRATSLVILRGEWFTQHLHI